MAIQILFRRGLASEWTDANPVLGEGEPGVETDTSKLKIGDGSTAWADLDYAAGLESLRLQDLLDVASTAPSTGEVLKYNGTAWEPAADEAGSGGIATLDELTDVVITGTPSDGQVLKYDSGTSKWVNGTDETGGGSIVGVLDDLTDVVITGTPSDGQVLKYDSGTSKWVNGTDAVGSGAGLATRTTAFVTSSLLAADASEDLAIEGFKSYALLKVETDGAAWVRIYTDTTSRTADSSRLEGTDPTSGSGVIAEIITTGADSILISPGAFGFSNEASPTTDIPITITNKSVSDAAITVTLTLLQLEA